MTVTEAAAAATVERDAPYVGLSVFSEDDAAIFFGREHERATLISNLRAARLTLLYAQSGTGKSSLLRAGVAARTSGARLVTSRWSSVPGGMSPPMS